MVQVTNNKAEAAKDSAPQTQLIFFMIKNSESLKVIAFFVI